MLSKIRDALHKYYSVFQPIYAPIFNKARRRWRDIVAYRRERRRVRRELEHTHQKGIPVKIILGAGITRYDGWVHTDIPYMNMFDRDDWDYFFDPHTIDNLLLEHVVEHITIDQFRTFLTIANEYLAPGGKMRIVVPDGYHPDPQYIDFVRPGGYGPGCDDHEVLYTIDLMTSILEDLGYRVMPIEYYDVNGVFHQFERQAADGPIVRDKSFTAPAEPLLDYSSLIVDCVMESH